MALIEKLIEGISEAHLRQRIAEEVKKLKGDKKFGLVFEEHLPEVVPLYDAPITKGCTASLRKESLGETWIVKSIKKNEANCISEKNGVEASHPIKDLVAVKKFGEPIFPSLLPIESVNRGENKPHHLLIEADNYHALQLLLYTHSSKIDCIYIDPPYNTGARDWKYNNDYVDLNDTYRHSKWLSFIKKRLILAMRLLKPSGVMVITIDDYEIHHLRALLEENIFSEMVELGVVCIRNNPGGRATANGFAVNHEYALFIGRTTKAKIGRLERTEEQLARYKELDEVGPFEWVNFRKHGADSDPEDRERQYYPIYVQGEKLRLPKMKWDEDKRKWLDIEPPRAKEIAIWPKNNKGKPKVWGWGAERFADEIDQFKTKTKKDGSLQIYKKERVPIKEGMLPGTWWDKTQYSSNESGTKILQNIFEGEDREFPYPKSMYAVVDTLKAAGIGENKNALILDFFAGSGTTLHAVCLLNAADGGSRTAIAVTNNEVHPEDLATKLLESGVLRGNDSFEKFGICRSITYPRCEHVIRGRHFNNTEIHGEYLTGKKVNRQVNRTIRTLNFTTAKQLENINARVQLAALLELKANRVTDEDWYLYEDEPKTVLWNPEKLDNYCEELTEIGQHVTDIYISPSQNETFQFVKKRIQESLSPLVKLEDEKRPFSDGFKENLQYFRLNFLDPTKVELGRHFSALLPVLWIMAGGVGDLPKATGKESFLIPDCPFAVLLDEKHYKKFQQKLRELKKPRSHVFIVTDSTQLFRDMRDGLDIPHSFQLYKNYLDNFHINTVRSE